MSNPLALAARSLSNLIPPGREGLVWWLTVLASLGVTSVIPLLPVYAVANGADLDTLGIMAAAYLVTNLLFLYGAGRLSDWVGRRPLMAVGLGTYAFCSIGFLVWPSPAAFIILRAIEGVAAACFLPAALAYVADRFPMEQRGLRISQLAIAENLGLLVGPAFGGLVKTTLGMPALFIILTVLCGIGALMIAYLPTASAASTTDAPKSSHWGDVRWLLLVGVSFRAACGGFAFGLYLTVWALYFMRLGGGDWHIALSWTLFAIPSLFIGAWAGRLIDRSGPGPSAALGAAFSALVVGLYAIAPNVNVLLALCVLEGVGFAFAYPAQNTLSLQTAPPDMRGRVIGLVTAIKTGGMLLGAILAPKLYAIGPVTVFGTTSLILLTGAVVLGYCLVLDARRNPKLAAVPSQPLAEIGAP